MPKISKGTGILFLLLIIGGIFGSLLGEILSGFLPFLAYGRSIRPKSHDHRLDAFNADAGSDSET